ncbi:MAG: glucosaminidase domain-containing protein [Lewinellaceae bacterium]|nr:glucosaminidase domain-containing protein [Saprospiraceae bacterium]MCB9345702.1 glucosaminidase domain-containing protein [Lewinellaceae bacterium]
MRNLQICLAITLLVAASSFKLLSTASDNSNNDQQTTISNEVEGESTDSLTISFSNDDNKIARFCAYLPYAKQAQAETGIHASVILAQAALESGWGEYAVGNMFFGIKDTEKGATGKGQLLRTTEYFSSPDQTHLFPKVYSVKWNNKRKMYKYDVLDWFRKYDSPAESFKDHARFIVENDRYAEAMKYASDPIRFVQEISKAGYATAPGYARLMVKMVRMIQSENARVIGS